MDSKVLRDHGDAQADRMGGGVPRERVLGMTFL